MVSFGRGNAASLLLLVATATSVLGAPLNEADFSHPDLVSRQAIVPDKREQLCDHDLSKESQSDVWRKTGVGLNLDLYIDRSYGGYSNWTQNLDKFTWKKSQSDAWDCTSIPGKCGPPADCHEFRDLVDQAAHYWIFKSITGAHKVISKLHEELQNTGIVLSFGLDTVISDFKGSAKDLTGVYAKAAGAFTVGAGLVSALPGAGAAAGGAMTSIAGIFSLAALNAPADPKDSVNSYLTEYFKQSQKALTDLARNLFGDGDQDKVPKTADPGSWKTPIAQFLGSGRFLIDNVDVATRATVEQGKKHLQQAIGMSVLNSQGWKLVIDPGVKNEGDCTKSGGASIWKSGPKECWGILKWERVFKGLTEGPPGRKAVYQVKINHLPGDIVQKMKDYEFDFHSVYDNAVACQLAHPNGGDRTIKVENLVGDGKLPECFFSIDVLKGTFTYSDFKPQDLWSKW